MRRHIIHFALLMLILLPIAVSAQVPSPVSPAHPGDADPRDQKPSYQLAPDDVISISVSNFPELTKAQMVIPPDGKINVQYLPAFSITGMTVDQLADTLTSKWKKYVVDPLVSVSIVEKRKDTVLVYGYVLRPGNLEYKQNTHILQAIGSAGGALLEADLKHVTLTRKTGDKQIVDLTNPASKSGTDADLVLFPDDSVYLPLRHLQVNVLGQVHNPGNVEYKDDMTLEQAITAAGSIDFEVADLGKATLTRDNTKTPLNLEALYHEADRTQNIVLKPDDIIFIPENKDRTYIFGAVEKPGYYRIKPGDRVLDALREVGGPLPTADQGNILVRHVNPDQTSSKPIRVSLIKFVEKSDPSQNPELHPGDYVFIPDKKHRLNSNDIWGALNAFSLLRIFGL